MTTCYSSFLVGMITLGLLIYDMVMNEWGLLWQHAMGGIVLTGIIWLLCYFLNDTIAFGVLVIPTLFFLVFSLGIIMTGESLKRQGCCVRCTGINPEEIKQCEFNTQLKATSLV